MKRIIFWKTVLLCIIITFSGCSSENDKKLSHIERGKAYFEKEEYKAAIIEYKNAIQIDPEDIESYRLLAAAATKSGDLQEAFKTLSHIERVNPEDSDVTIQLATMYFLGKNTEEATVRVDRILEKEPQNIKALYLKSGILGRNQNLQGAADTYRQIMLLDKAQDRAHIGLSQILLRQEKYDEAEALLKSSIDTFPDNETLKMALFALYRGQRKFDEAETILNQAIAGNPDSAKLEIGMAQLMLMRNQPEKTVEAFNRALQKAPDKAQPYVEFASYYEAIGKPEEAKRIYNTGMEKNPESVELMIKAAELHIRLKQLDMADQYLAKAKNVRPDFLPVLYVEGQIHLSRNNLENALQIFDRIVSEEPRSARGHYFKGLVHFMKQEQNIALTSLTQAVELNPQHLKANLLLARLYWTKGEIDKAREHCENIIKIKPGERQALMLLGQIYTVDKDYDKARKIFSWITEKDPGNPEGYFRLGQIDFLEKKTDAALANYNKALDINPKLMDVFTHLIIYHASQKQYDLALERCDQQLKLVSDQPGLQGYLHQIKGDIYKAIDDLPRAETAYRKAVELNPKLVKSYRNLASIFIANGKTDEAVAQYQSVLKSNPKQPGIHVALGSLYEQQKEFALAEQHYREALNVDSQFAPAANNLAFIILLKKDGDINEALRLAQLAKSVEPENPAVMDTLGWVYYKKELYESARYELAESVKKLPENPTVNYHLGMTYFKLDKKDLARKYLTRAIELDKDFQGADEAKRTIAEL